jgi:hypothetical protein
LKQSTPLAHKISFGLEGIYGEELTTTTQVTGSRLGSDHKLY